MKGNTSIFGLSVLLASVFLFSTSVMGQKYEERNADFWGVSFAYGLDFSAGDLSDRFGQHFHASMGIDIFKLKWNAMLRIEGSIMFGSNVKEDVISVYRAQNGAILGNDGAYADIFLRQRGSYLGVMLDKILIPQKQNKYSGLSAGLGLGLYQHNIRFNVDTNNTPQFEGDYAKGYDRNAIGPALKQNIGYMHIGRNRNLNYQISVVLIEAFTSPNRSIDFDTGLKEEGSRFDMSVGLEFRWIIPLKDKQEAEEIFY